MQTVPSLANRSLLKRHDAAFVPVAPKTSTSAVPVAAAERDVSQSIAIVHDWCPSFRGGERVLARLAKLHPGSDIFTLFDFLPQEVKDEYFPGVRFTTSGLNRLPWIEKYYRSLFFACPFAMEQFDVTKYDAVISSSAAFARGILTRPDQPHLCYVHSPIRYAWDEQFSYLEQGKMGFGPKGLLFRWFLYHLRTWDARTAHGPDLMLANSNFVKARIRRIYGREARVVFPPVDFNELTYVQDKDPYYITASFLAPYKRTDLVIRAFNEMPAKRLLVVGDGQQSSHLRQMAGPNVEFTGFLPRTDYVNAVANAKALVFAGCEDFGIALAEAQYCGTPLIAFARGGANDIVRPLGGTEPATGVLFNKQDVRTVVEAVGRFEAHSAEITAEACHLNGLRFSAERFDREILDAVEFVRDISRKATLSGGNY